MGTGMDGCRQIINACLFQSFCRKARSSDSHIKNFGNGSTDSPFVCNLISKDHVICHNTRLTVGRTCQIIQPRSISQWMTELDSIAHRINMLVGSLQVIINLNTAHLPYLQSGLYRQ